VRWVCHIISFHIIMILFMPQETAHSAQGDVTFRFPVLSSGAPQGCVAYTKLSRKRSVTCLVSSGYVPHNNSGVHGVFFLLIFELPSQMPKKHTLVMFNDVLHIR